MLWQQLLFWLYVIGFMISEKVLRFHQLVKRVSLVCYDLFLRNVNFTAANNDQVGPFSVFQ